MKRLVFPLVLAVASVCSDAAEVERESRVAVVDAQLPVARRWAGLRAVSQRVFGHLGIAALEGDR